MCGRYTHLYTWEQLHRLLCLTSPAIALARRYNLAPSQEAPVVRAGEAGSPGRFLAMLRWGLLPHWAKDGATGHTLINARSETAATTPAFRGAFRHRRCLVPVSGFYEWAGQKGTRRQPFYITPVPPSTADAPPILVLAGLWESCALGDPSPSQTFCILTTQANDFMRPMHDRMPVVLASPEARDRWLDPGTPLDDLASLLRPPANDLLRCWPVSTRVNRPSVDGVDLIEPIDQQPFADSLFS